MTVEVVDLIIQPFREVIERGKDAITNAERSQEDGASALRQKMLGSAQGLVREGKRALQRVLPLLLSQLKTYGGPFEDALRKHDGLLKSLRDLEHALYDLDDFILLETFEVARYEEVQEMCKAFALTAIETLKRLRVDQSMVPTSAEPQFTFPPLPPLPALPEGLRLQSRREPTGMVQTHGGDQMTLVPRSRSTSLDEYQSTASLQQQPKVHRISRSDSSPIPQMSTVPLSHGSPDGASEASAYPPIPTKSPRRQLSRRSIAPALLQDRPYRNRETTAEAYNTGQSGGAFPALIECENSWESSLGGLSLSETMDALSHRSTSSKSSRSRSDSDRTSSTSNSGIGSVSSVEIRSLVSADGWTANSERSEGTDLNYEAKAAARPSRYSKIPENGKPIWYSQKDNCVIGATSTLHQYKSFCTGALECRADLMGSATRTTEIMDPTAMHSYQDSMSGAVLALGVVPFGSRKTVTQCRDCEYQHSKADFDRDLDHSRNASIVMEGVLFRPRFLYKSHLVSHSTSTYIYGCIFCSQAGHTTREGDATVFTSRRQLLRHLSYHSQPLPEVAGVQVLYGETDRIRADSCDYDLYFPDLPQLPPIAAYKSIDILPTAVALGPSIQKGDKRLTDPDGRGPVLEFLIGARIVGIEFPDGWDGKWCTGWHNGVRGAFPAKLIALDTPSKSATRTPGTNNEGVVVTSKWKWQPKDPEIGWLTFDKNTTITNVSWLNQDSWCWSGTTRDGRSGIFPSSHIKTDSIRDPAASPESTSRRDTWRVFKTRHLRAGSTSTMD